MVGARHYIGRNGIPRTGTVFMSNHAALSGAGSPPFRNEHDRHPRLKISFSSLPTYAFALSRFVCGRPPIFSRDLFVWHHASRLSQTHQSDGRFSQVRSLVSDAFCAVPFQIWLRCPLFLLALMRGCWPSRDANLTDTDKAKILHAAKTAAARISVKRVLTGSAMHAEKRDSTCK
jgi:hypothetical protein